MLIRKKFNVESAHIVRNCTSHRCSHSIHGHSAEIDVYLTSTSLDNAGMVCDFGLLKGTVKEFIDSMDHCYLLCSKDSAEFRDFIKSHCDRWIEMPFNPSAECLALFVHKFTQDIINHTNFNNGEGHVEITNVRYRETESGWAQTDQTDVSTLWHDDWCVEFSNGVMKDWSCDLVDILVNDKVIINPSIIQQINLR